MGKAEVKITVGVLVFNPMATLRMQLVERTLKSLRKAFPDASKLACDNVSTDGSQQWFKKVALCKGFVAYLPTAGDSEGTNRTPGAGRLRIMKSRMVEVGIEELGTELVVLSDDDMDWKPGADKRLREAWAHAPDDVKIISGLLEPVWHWNTPREAIQCGKERTLVRDSCPGAAWTFRAKDWRLIRDHVVADFGYDYKACVALRENGYRVAQMDLAEHIGWGASTHGNEADQHLDTRPLDREKWGI
jgi:hypothetical protein